jgi:hypothetical protein
MHHAQRAQLTIENIAVEVVLQAVRGLFEQQAMGAAGCGQALLRDALEGLDQVADDPQLPGAEARHGLQLGATAHSARQHREGRLHRLDETRVGDALGNGFAIARRHQAETGVGLGRDLLQDAARMQFVLAGQHRIHRGAWPAHALGQHGGCQRAELLVVGGHRLPAGARSRRARRSTKRVRSKPGRRALLGKLNRSKPAWSCGNSAAQRPKPMRSQS